jgi:hypothetical protein
MPDNVGGSVFQLFEKAREIGDVLAHPPLPRRAFALAMTAPVVAEHPVPPGDVRHQRIPTAVVVPGPVHEHDRISPTVEPVMQPHTTNRHVRHARIPSQPDNH